MGLWRVVADAHAKIESLAAFPFKKVIYAALWN